MLLDINGNSEDGFTQGSVLALLLFNIYIYDLPSITSKKYAYADDLASRYSSGDWKVLERTLNEDMTTLSAYLQTCRLKLSHAKMVTQPFLPIIKRPTVAMA